MPEKVSSVRSVPPYIQKPPYVSTTPGKDACPPHIEIHSPEQIHKIKEACSLARKILNLTAKELKVSLNYFGLFLYKQFLIPTIFIT